MPSMGWSSNSNQSTTMTAKQRNQDRILEYLAKKPATRAELAEKLSLAHNTVWRWLERLNADGPRMVYISGWVRTADGEGQPTPVFSIGTKTNVPCRLLPVSEKERSRRRRNKLKAENRWEDKLARDRQKYWSKKLDAQVPQRDPLTAALFGAQPQSSPPGQPLDN